MSTEAQKRASLKYQAKMTQLVFKMNPEEHSDIIEFWKSKENRRQAFIEITRELIEKERQ